MINFVRDVLLREVMKRVVIFIDEIDVTLRLPFADDYFAALRAIYNARPTTPEFGRVSFVLTGVVDPSELIRDPRRTPFNIGVTVKLDDFTAEEAMPLGGELGLPPQHARQVLARVLKWSGGHPYLTLRICHAIAEGRKTHWSDKEIDELVRMLFFTAEGERDNNLLFVSDMLTHRMQPDLDRVDLLLTYRDILLERPVLDVKASRVHRHLKLSGIVKSQGGRLHVRNMIYREAFGVRWINEHVPAVRRLIRDSWRPKNNF
jgi:hypothetical protein